MGDHKAFFYGTLMAPKVLYRVCHGTADPEDFYKSLLTIRPAILPGYERRRVKDCDYPAIIPAEGSQSSDQESASGPSVQGTCVTGLTEGDLWRLDIFEGSEYKRIKVKVHVLAEGDQSGSQNSPGSAEVEVETYVWIADRSDLEDAEWDFDDFVRTKMARWTGGWEEYQEVDAAVNALDGKDPTNGRGNGGAITERLRGEGA